MESKEKENKRKQEYFLECSVRKRMAGKKRKISNKNIFKNIKRLINNTLFIVLLFKYYIDIINHIYN